MSGGEEPEGLPAAVFVELVDLPEEQAVDRLLTMGWFTVSVAMQLAQWALERADIEPAQAARALALSTLLAADFGNPAALLGQIAYGEARCAVQSGDLAAAEDALLRAQASWRAIDERGPLARSFLGLTQVLTMQGRYGEAEVASREAINALQDLADTDPSARMLLSRAHRNRATLFVYQEQHAAARDAYGQALEELAHFVTALPAEEQGELDGEFGHLALNVASAHTFLDDPDAAISSLQEAIARFERAGDSINRGRAQTNLGRLYLRLGEYAAALTAFDQASRDLIGDLPLDSSLDPSVELTVLRRADELLLEHALAYIALNLLPEAEFALERCERLFRQTGQPYELAQSRYALGILRLQQGAWQESQAALDEAVTLYSRLDNRFWLNRSQLAHARLLLAQGDRANGAARLDDLLGQLELATAAGAIAWDMLGHVDLRLLRLHEWLASENVDEAEAAANEIENLLGYTTQGETIEAASLPHLALRLLHARGRIATQRGDGALARRHFTSAVDLLDRQRGTLPLEEVRTAYLDDKMVIYGDLVLSLLASPIPSGDEVAAAFAVVERARSRALLERLLASVDNPEEEESTQIRDQRAALRRQLHWFYNQLLGDSGSRRLEHGLSRDVAQHEAAIQQLEWRSAPLMAQAEPVSLLELQEKLEADQQAAIYFFAGDEVIAFVVGQHEAHVVRRLATIEQVMQALAELRFQLGRAEVGNDYVARHHARLMRGVQDALGQLYQLLVAPLQHVLHAGRVLISPFGLLHVIPFHALWDGNAYWLEEVELSYVPSASIAVHKRNESSTPLMRRPMRRFAGFAPFDARIPHAQAEIDGAATYFECAQRYHDGAATVANLTAAASTCDCLHLATHGLFRSDNSFFSALKFSDGWLDVREIYRLRVAARLVVLSACESGVGQVRAGDEVVGLARGFLAAGAQELIASLWNVHDQSAAQLMVDFYRMLQGEELAKDGSVRPATALRAAQLRALRNGEHPYFWASFFAIG